MSVKPREAFNAFLNHLMANKGTCCYAPANRYCEVVKQLKEAYSKSLKRGYDDFRSNKKR